MAMLGSSALTRRPVRSMDGQMLSPAGSSYDPLAPLPAAPQAMPSSPPLDMGSVRGFPSSGTPGDQPSSSPMFSLNVPQLAPLPPSAPHHKFFTKDGTGTGNVLVGILADALSGAAGQPGHYAQAMEQRRQEQTAFERGEVQYQRRRADELTDRQTEANKPQYFSGSEDRIAYDPTTQTTRTLYDAPTDAQVYAGSLGYQSGSPDYTGAVKDYVLRSNGPTAVQSRFGLENLRTDGRQRLQSERLGVTRRGQDLSHTDRQRGQSMNDARIRDSAGFKGRGKPAPAGGAEPFAVGADGHKIVVRNGKWVDAATGKPVS